MANEKRLIDANALWEKFEHEPWYDNADRDEIALPMVFDAPTVDAVSRGVHDQVRWERDVAMKQLEEHSISFGGIAPDVVKVVRCKDCKHSEPCGESRQCLHPFGLNACDGNDFCSYGERREGE